MKKTDLAYMAGAFDGEGCIHIGRLCTKGRFRYHLQCSVSNTEEWLPNMFHFAWGGSVSDKLEKRHNWRDRWEWQISGEKAANFLEIIYPYLHLKQPQAELALQFQAIHGTRRRHPKRTEAELAIQEVQYHLMRGMKNKKSPPICKAEGGL